MQKIKNLIHFFIALSAGLFYRFPGRSMTVIAITGTDGKTTTTHLLYNILKAARVNVSMVSTIQAVIGKNSYETGFHVTTPNPWALQKFMRQAANWGSTHFVLEVTSHALDQYRVFGASIDIGIITNVSHEHIDYHKTFANYLAAKAKILHGVTYSVLNRDDKNFDYLAAKASGKLVTFSIDNQADYTLADFTFRPKMIGKFNLYNCLAAAVAAKLVGVNDSTISASIAKFEGIPGRMEEIETKRPFKVYIDFAHKPNALENALKSARELTRHKLIVVFGCAGLRDRLKRPMMGEIAAQLADYIIITAEDPRTEDVRQISQEISAGCLKAKAKEKTKRGTSDALTANNDSYFWRIPDRQEAINFAIRKLAQKGDVVLTLGKGHEKSMCYGKIEYPWDERKAIKKALYGTNKIAA